MKGKWRAGYNSMMFEGKQWFAYRVLDVQKAKLLGNIENDFMLFGTVAEARKRAAQLNEEEEAEK